MLPVKSLKIIGQKRILKREKAYNFNKERTLKSKSKNYSDYTNKTISNIENIIMNTQSGATRERRYNLKAKNEGYNYIPNRDYRYVTGKEECMKEGKLEREDKTARTQQTEDEYIRVRVKRRVEKHNAS